METFQHVDVQYRSSARLDALADELAKAAAVTFETNPEADVVGLIIEGRTPESESLWIAVEHATRRLLKGPCASLLIRRSLAAEILMRSAGPQSVEWLAQNATRGRLAIVISCKHGFRQTAVPILGGPERRAKEPATLEADLLAST